MKLRSKAKTTNWKTSIHLVREPKTFFYFNETDMKAVCIYPIETEYHSSTSFQREQFIT